ncbi:MAG TPA: hypothetical protein VKV40_08045 [Ktedonobacteraceae bacterium]|nr:hypothetical protein [Ktedonobacteraceae bacterium]
MDEDSTNTPLPAVQAQAQETPASTTGPLRPLGSVFAGLRRLFPGNGRGDLALAPTPTNQELAAQIEQLSLDASTPIATIVAMLSGETDDVAEVIESFDEEKEHPIGKIMNLVVTLLCYLAPWVLAVYAGAALGNTYAGKPFALFNAMTAFYYFVSWAYEFILVGLMVAIVRQFKRVTGGNKRSVPTFIALLVFFLVIAVTSASAQWILFEHRINVHDQAQLIGALFRTLGTPLVDSAGAMVLAVLHIKSLEQHLYTLQKKTDAKIAINRKKLQSKIELVNAAMEVKNTLQKEEDYRQKNELANTIIGMFSEHAIEAIRDSLNGRKQDTGNSYRRDGYR